MSLYANKVAIVIFLAGVCQLLAQTGSIEGRVVNMDSKAGLSGANIQLDGELGTTSGQEGEFVFTQIKEGTYILHCSFIGFRSIRRSVFVRSGEKVAVILRLEPVVIPAEEITVTGTRYEKKVREVCLPLSVVNSTQIERHPVRTVADALKSEPGISLASDGPWATHLSIRGLSRNNIVLLVDGNRLDTATDLAAGFALIDVNDIERIEAVKGAASSLYGTGAVGGTVNIITKGGWYGSEFYTKTSLLGGYSSVNNQAMGHASLNIGDDRWYARISCKLRNADDMETPQGELQNSQFRDNNISAGFAVKPGQNHEVRLNYQRYFAEDVGIPGAYPLFPADADVRYPKEKREMASAEYVMTNITPSLTRFSIKYFEQNILRDVENIPHVVSNIPAGGGQPPRQISVLRITPAARHGTQGVLLQTDWLAAKRHFVIAGVDAWRKDLDSHRERFLRIDVKSEVDGTIVRSIEQVIGERPLPLASYGALGVFVHDEISLWRDKLVLSVGGRYDVISVKSEKVLNPLYQIVDGVKNENPTGQTVLWNAQRASDRSWSGNTGLLFRVTPEFDITANVGKSFRSPYLEERYQYIDLGSLVKIGDPELLPENGLFTDIGMRLWKTFLQFAANVFYNEMKNLVVESPAIYEGREALQKTNAGSALLYGFDVAVECSLSRRLSIYANAAYVNGQDTYTRTALALIPPLNGKIGFNSSVLPYLSVDFSATLFATQGRIAYWEYRTPGYAFFDVALLSHQFQWSAFQSRVLIGVENILDRSYRNHLASNRGLVSAEPGRNFWLRFVLER